MADVQPKPRRALGNISVNSKAQALGHAANAAAAAKPKKQVLTGAAAAAAGAPGAAAPSGNNSNDKPAAAGAQTGEAVESTKKTKSHVESVKAFVAARRLSKAEKEAAARAAAAVAPQQQVEGRKSSALLPLDGLRVSMARHSTAPTPEDAAEIEDEAQLFEAEVKLGYMRSAKEELEAKLALEATKHREELQALEAKLVEATQRARLAEQKIAGSVVAAPVPGRQDPVLAQPMKVTTGKKVDLTTGKKVDLTTGKKVATATAVKAPPTRPVGATVTATVAVPTQAEVVVVERKVVELVERVVEKEVEKTVEVERRAPPASPNVGKMEAAIEAAVAQTMHEQEAQRALAVQQALERAAADKEQALASAAALAKEELATALNAAYRDKMQALEAASVRARARE